MNIKSKTRFIKPERNGEGERRLEKEREGEKREEKEREGEKGSVRKISSPHGLLGFLPKYFDRDCF